MEMSVQGSVSSQVELPDVRRVIARAGNQGLQVLALCEPVHRLSNRTKGTPEAFAGVHLTSRGNRWVADQIAERLREMGVVPAP